MIVLTDEELKKMAELELQNYINNMRLMKKLKLFLLPKDEADKKNAIIEIRAGTGGLEASYLHLNCLKCMKK